MYHFFYIIFLVIEILIYICYNIVTNLTIFFNMTLSEIKIKVQYGDYNTLGKMLDVPSSTAKMRLFRGDKEAMNAMQLIIEGRDDLITSFQTK